MTESVIGFTLTVSSESHNKNKTCHYHLSCKFEAMNEITLRQLEYFVAVVDGGSLRAGAEKCFVTPASIGQALNELERSVDAELLHRQRSKGTQLTRAGRVVYEEAQQILSLSAGLKNSVDLALDRIKSTVVIGAFPTLSGWAFPPLISAFRRHYPNVQVELVEAPYKQLHEGLVAEEIDAAIFLRTHLRPGIKAEQIHSVPFRVLASARHPLSRQNSVRLNELREEKLVILNQPPVGELLPNLLRPFGLERNILWKTSSTDVIKNLVGRNEAVSILVGPGMHMYSNEGQELRALVVSDEMPAQAIMVGFSQRVHEGRTQRFITHALSEVSVHSHPPQAR